MLCEQISNNMTYLQVPVINSISNAGQGCRRVAWKLMSIILEEILDQTDLSEEFGS